MQNLELFFADREKRKRWTFLLYPLSQFYRVGLAFRHAMYRWGWLRSFKADIPVICVGSIFVGGSGKTPFVRLLLEHLGKDTWVLSRGYRHLDEPLFYKNCVVEKDRVWGVKRCLEQGARAVIMDDGLQHLRLKKDLKVALITQDQLENEWAFLPFGSLRDLPRILEETEVIVIHEVDSLETYNKITNSLRTNRCQRFIGTTTGFRGFLTSNGDPVVKMERALLLSSIARPHRFREMIASLGVEVVDHVVLPDHGKVSLSDLEALIKRAKMLNAILVTTEKDAVKYPIGTEIVQAKIGTEVVYDKVNFDQLLQKIEALHVSKTH
ncbi:MAG: tetraacyldisaccharide 4'-kinase [Chlamydiia bacterium]